MDDDEFDAMLGDMLDSPTPSAKNSGKGKKKSPSGKSKKGSSKSKSSKGDIDFSMSNDMSASASSFPSPQKGGRKGSGKLLTVNDDDGLSPANSPMNARGHRGSPTNFDSRDQWDESSARSTGDNVNKFGFSTDGPTDDGGLDDSILGNLLPSGMGGGGTKRLTSLNKPAVNNKQLQPLDNSFASSNSSLNNSLDNTNQPSKDAKMHPSPPVKQASTSYSKANTTDTTAAPQGSNRALSIFQNYSQNKNNYDSDGSADSPVTVPQPAVTETLSAPAPAPTQAADTDDDVDMGFIPTSMAPASSGARPNRRQLAGGSSIFKRPTVDPSSSFDELDKVLGFNSTGPQKPRDPFASTGGGGAGGSGGNIPPLPHTPAGSQASVAGNAKGENAPAAKFPSPQRQIVRTDAGRATSQREDNASSTSGSDDDMTAPVRVGAGTIVGGGGGTISTDVGVNGIAANAPLTTTKSASALPSITGNSATSSAHASGHTSTDPDAAGLRRQATEDDYEDDFHSPVPIVVDTRTIVQPIAVPAPTAPAPTAPVAGANSPSGGKKTRQVQHANASFEFEEPMDSVPKAAAVSPTARTGGNARAEKKRSTAEDPSVSSPGIVLSTATVGGGMGSSYHPAWLPAAGGTPATTSTPSAGDGVRHEAVAEAPTAAPDVHSSTLVRQLQQKLEASQLQYEAVERQLRGEVELWKQKLVSSATSQAQNPSVEASDALSQQVVQQKRMIAQLEAENARLKDDAIIQSLRQSEEVKYMVEKHRQLTEEMEHSRQVEVQEVQARHDQSLAALKRIHSEELVSIKDRAKEGDVLTQISSQMKTTSGSLKLMEEQLHLKYKALEAAREGQMEARERLLSEMEQKARERADAAEAEGFRLKGLLVHMEHMVENLRSQSGEEKERLRMEHARLQTMQSSLEAERTALHARAQEENASIKHRLLELEGASRKVVEEKQAAAQDIAEGRRKFEADKADFAAFARNSTKSAELGFSRLKDEEVRLIKIREDVAAEKHLLEQRKVAAMHDIEAAQSVQQAVQAQYEEIRAEKDQLSQLASELQVASEQLAQRDAQLDELAVTLEEREGIVQNGVRDMNESARSLSRREAEVTALAQNLEHQQGILEGIDNDLLNKKVALASSLRQQDAQRASRTMTSVYSQLRDRGTGGEGTGPLPGTWSSVDSGARTVPFGGWGSSETEKKTSPVSVADRNHSPARQHQASPRGPKQQFASTSGRSGLDQSSTAANNSAAMIKNEIEKSKRVLETSKLSHLRSARDTSTTTQLFIQNETDFLNTIRNISGQNRSSSGFNTSGHSSAHLDATNIYGSYLD